MDVSLRRHVGTFDTLVAFVGFGKLFFAEQKGFKGKELFAERKASLPSTILYAFRLP